jgi:hypothetical protein
MKRRTTVLSLAAVLSLTAAGYAVAHGDGHHWGGRPSTVPPPHHRHHGHGYGHGGFGGGGDFGPSHGGHAGGDGD